MSNTQHKPWAPVSLGAVYMITITILHTYVVFETDTQFTFALVLLVRSDAALANQTAASKTLVNSLNDEGLLLWLHCYDYDAESLIVVINVIKVKKIILSTFFIPVVEIWLPLRLWTFFVYQNILETSIELTQVWLVPLSNSRESSLKLMKARKWNTHFYSRKFSSLKIRLLL